MGAWLVVGPVSAPDTAAPVLPCPVAAPPGCDVPGGPDPSGLSAGNREVDVPDSCRRQGDLLQYDETGADQRSGWNIQAYKRIFGFVPQDNIVHGNLTVEKTSGLGLTTGMPETGVMSNISLNIYE